MKCVAIIPARYASTRFPGKPLVEIKGKSMISRVYQQVKGCASVHRVIIATDDERIFSHCLSFDAEVIMTSAHHPSGTDRCHEVANLLDLSSDDVVVNIQGDEPFIHPDQIEQVISVIRSPTVSIATLIRKVTSVHELNSSDIPKVVVDSSGSALYFSRFPIPFVRDVAADSGVIYWRHLGLYAYKVNALHAITDLKPSMLERSEALEQLRWLENGWKIHTAITTLPSWAVDTPEDLKNLPDF